MAPVKAPASQVVTPLKNIPAEVSESVEEGFAFCQANPLLRLIAAFADEDEVNLNRGYIRSYCQARPAGRLTVSIFNGYTGLVEVEVEGLPELVQKFSPNQTEACQTPALSLFFKVYVKKDTTETDGQAEPSSSA
jgi:hypothetical protein